jgi:hypothetical protein
MQKREFEDRIGLVISQEEYEVIEAAYVGLPESVDKDKFAKIWLKEGGIQDLFDKRMLRIKTLTDTVISREERIQANGVWMRNVEDLANGYELEVRGLRNTLSAIWALVNEQVGVEGVRDAEV